MTTLFSRAFWTAAFERSVQTFAATFAASGFFTGGQPTVKGLCASLTAAGLGALYQFVKQLGGTQAVSAAVKSQS